MIAPMDETIQLNDCNDPASASGSSLALCTISASAIASEKASETDPVAIIEIAQKGVVTHEPILTQARIPRTLDSNR